MADRLLIAGVGYPDISDLSFGPKLVERLRDVPLPPGVQIEDLSYGPIPILHWFEDEPGRFERAIFVGAEERGREPGSLSTYGWMNAEPDPEDVQARVCEAVTGVISLENLLVILQHFGALPTETSVVELEPADREWGASLSPAGARRMEEAVAWIRRELHSGSQYASNGHREEVRRHSE